MTRELLRLAALLVAIALGSASAAEVVGGGAALPDPRPWSSSDAQAAAAHARVAADDVEFQWEPGLPLEMQRPLGSAGGTDEAPLRVQCSISVVDESALGKDPALLALRWTSGAIIAVGIGADPAALGAAAGEGRRAWLASAIAGKSEVRPAGIECYPGGCPGHVRLVATTRDISAFASRDGWNWTCIGSWERAADLVGPPERVTVSCGGALAGHPRAADLQPHAAPVAIRFSRISVGDAPASLPASLLKDYEKKASLEEALDGMMAASQARQWQILGPLGAGANPVGPDGRIDLGARFDLMGVAGGWKPFAPGDNPQDRIIILSDLLPRAQPGILRFAATTISVDHACQTRLLFDGTGTMSVSLNGRELARIQRDGGEVRPDRFAVVAPLSAGENHLLVRLVSDRDGRAVFTFRHEEGDPLYRIALLRRLAVDFSGESDAIIAGAFEASSCWENLGYAHEAAAALDGIIADAQASADQVDRALIERTRLHRTLRDEATVSADIDALRTRWQGASGADSASALIKIAQLWERLDEPAKAEAALGQALAAAGTEPEAAIQTGLACARAHARLGDRAAIAADLRAIAGLLPAADPQHGEFLVASLAAQDATPAQLEAAVAGIEVARLSATALRQLAGVAQRISDRRIQRAALAALSASSARDPLDAADVASAESMADGASLRVDEAPEFAQRYRSAIATLAGGAAADAPGGAPGGGTTAASQTPGSWRSAFLRACLGDSPSGSALLRDASQVAADRLGHHRLPAEPRNFVVAGWLDNTDFRCYDPHYLAREVHPDHLDISKPIEGKPWISPGARAWDKGYLDLLSLFHKENCCAFAYAEIASDAVVDAKLSMGADDGLVVWFNGAKVHEDRTQRGIVPDSIVVPVRFRKGTNTILAMIQQGGGDWAFQLRIIDGGNLDDIASVLALDEDLPASRSEAAQRLTGVLDGLMRMGRYPEAVAVGRMVVRAFPDRPEEQYDAAARLAEAAVAAGDAVLARHLAAWLSGSVTAFSDANLARTRQALLGLGSLLGSAGECEDAAAAYRQLLRSAFDGGTQVQAWYGLGELYRHAGYKRQAARCYGTAAGLPIEDPRWAGLLHQGIMSTRANVADVAPVDPPTAAAAQLASADDAAASGNAALAVAGYQRIIETSRAGQLWQDGAGHFIPVAAVCQQRLRALGPSGLLLYRQSFEARAQSQLQRCDPWSTADFEAVALDFPLSAAAAQALDRAADLYQAQGSPALGGATTRELLSGNGDLPAPRPLLLAKAAHMAAAGGDRAAIAGITAELGSGPGSVTIGGATIGLAVYLDQLKAAMPAPPPAADAPFAAASIVCTFPVTPMDARDAGHFSAGRELHAVCRGACEPGTAYIQTLEAAFAVATASGAVRWQARNELPDVEPPRLPSDFSGLPEYTPAISGGRVVGRMVQRGRAVIEARDAADGALAWSTDLLPQLSGMSAASSPAAAEGRIYALFVDHERSYAAAISCRDGQLLWLTPVSTRRGTVPVQGDFGVFTDGNAAAPACMGRDLFVANDLGGVLCIDAGNGQVRWMATYLRAVLGTGDASSLVRLLDRVPTRVWVDDERVYVAPRDTLSVLAFTRSHGDAAWSRELSQARQIAGFAGPGRLLLQGDGLELIDARTGLQAWRWRPDDDDGPTLGTAAISATSAYAATTKGVYRIGLERGEIREFHDWRSIGVGSPLPVNLQLTQDGLIGIGNGVVVKFLATPAPARGPVSIQAASAQAIAPASALPPPPAPPGSPLGLSWVLHGEAVRSIDHPAAWPASDGLVRFERSIARIDAARARVAWRTPIVPSLVQWGFSRDTILLVYQQRLWNRLTALDLDSGRERWSEDIGNYFVDAVDENPEGRQCNWYLCDDAIIKWDLHGNLVAFSPATGAKAFAFNTGGVLLAATSRSGRLFLAIRRGDRDCIEEYDMATQARVATAADGPADGDDIALDAAGGLILGHRDHADRFDLATRAVTRFPFSFVTGEVLEEPGRSVAFGLTRENRWNGHWTSAIIDSATGAASFQETVVAAADPAAASVCAGRLYGSHVVGIGGSRDGRNGILCRDVPDGKEAWFIPGGDPAQLAYCGQAGLGQEVVVFRTQADTGFGYQMIDAGSGRIAAAGPLPGWPGVAMPVATLGGAILYGTGQGLFAVAPVLPAAVQASDPDHALSADADAAITASWAPATTPGASVPTPEAVRATTIDAADRRPMEVEPGRDASGVEQLSALSADLRCSYDAESFHIRVMVADGNAPHRDPCPGASLTSGDCVLIGIDPQDSGGSGRSSAVTMAVAWADGRTRLSLIGGRFACGEDGRPLGHPDARAAADPTGMAYEVSIPWKALRSQEDKRPGDGLAMRIGVAVIAHGDRGHPIVEELGHGLIRGIEPRLWLRCTLTPAPRR